MLTLTATQHTTNDKNGNGRYSTPRKRKKRKDSEADSQEFSYLNSNTDLTMQFTKTRDPIYFVFEKLESRSISELMSDFVKDSLYEASKLISQVMQ